MKATEAFLSGRPYRRNGYHTGAYFQLLAPYEYFSMADVQAEDWELEPLPQTVTMTVEAVEAAIDAAYKEEWGNHSRVSILYGHMILRPSVALILKHLGFK